MMGGPAIRTMVLITAAQQGEPPIAVRVAPVLTFLRIFLKVPGQAVAKIVQSVGEDGQAVGPQAADDFDEGEAEVQEESDFDIA